MVKEQRYDLRIMTLHTIRDVVSPKHDGTLSGKMSEEEKKTRYFSKQEITENKCQCHDENEQKRHISQAKPV